MKTFSDLANPWIGKLARYEPGRPIEEVARELGFGGGDDILKLASNENALGPSPKAIKAMKVNASKMHLYPDGDCFYLKRALSKKLNVKPTELLVGAGSNELVEFIGHVFLGAGSGIVMDQYAFVVYRLIAAMFQAETVMAPSRHFGHDLDAMLAAIQTTTKVVFVSNPNNPTSTLLAAPAIDRFMANVPDHVIVCFDEAYIELLPLGVQPDVLKYVREGRKVMVLRTFSKSYGLAGLRIGYMIAPEECIGLVNRVRQPFNVNAMAQVAAVAALEDDAYVAKTRDLVKNGIAYFERECKRLGLEFVPAVANFLLVKTGRGREVFAALQKEGVIVRPVDPYGLGDFIRITIGKPTENRKCIQALEKVLKSF